MKLDIFLERLKEAERIHGDQISVIDSNGDAVDFSIQNLPGSGSPAIVVF